MSQNKTTTNQHYIPQCYLKQFSPDEENIYQYDILSGKSTPVSVPIKSICYKKDLYEFRDDTNAFVHRNLIEKSLAIFEGDFAEVFRSIQSKSGSIANFNTQSFLSSKEKEILVLFLATMILRHPDHLKAAQETTIDVLGDSITETQARNIALSYCLPIYKEIDVNESNLLNSTLKLFDNMSYQIGVTYKDELWTCDFPVILKGYNIQNIIYQVILPISSRIALYMKPRKITGFGYYNSLIYMEKEDTDFVNRLVVEHSKRWIYSKKMLTEKQIKRIHNVKSKM